MFFTAQKEIDGQWISGLALRFAKAFMQPKCAAVCRARFFIPFFRRRAMTTCVFVHAHFRFLHGDGGYATTLLYSAPNKPFSKCLSHNWPRIFTGELATSPMRQFYLCPPHAKSARTNRCNSHTNAFNLFLSLLHKHVKWFRLVCACVRVRARARGMAFFRSSRFYTVLR